VQARNVVEQLFVASIVLALLLSSLTPVLAQSALSEITGEVQDPVGSAIPAVKITLTNTSTGVKTNLVANDAGFYYGRAILPGVYDITAEAAGFKTFENKGVELRTGQVLRMDVRLEVGAITERVEVSGVASAVELQKDSGDVSTTVNQQILNEMPKITRRTLQLVAITPAVTVTDKGGVLTINTPFFSTAGNPGVRASMFYTDGTSTTFARAQGDGGGMSGLNPSPEATEELRVVYNNYSAEFGWRRPCLLQTRRSSCKKAWAPPSCSLPNQARTSSEGRLTTMAKTTPWIPPTTLLKARTRTNFTITGVPSAGPLLRTRPFSLPMWRRLAGFRSHPMS